MKDNINKNTCLLNTYVIHIYYLILDNLLRYLILKNQGPERLINLLEFTQLLSDGAGIQTQAYTLDIILDTCSGSAGRCGEKVALELDLRG